MEMCVKFRLFFALAALGQVWAGTIPATTSQDGGYQSSGSLSEGLKYAVAESLGPAIRRLEELAAQNHFKNSGNVQHRIDHSITDDKDPVNEEYEKIDPKSSSAHETVFTQKIQQNPVAVKEVPHSSEVDPSTSKTVQPNFLIPISNVFPPGYPLNPSQQGTLLVALRKDTASHPWNVHPAKGVLHVGEMAYIPVVSPNTQNGSQNDTVRGQPNLPKISLPTKPGVAPQVLTIPMHVYSPRFSLPAYGQGVPISMVGIPQNVPVLNTPFSMNGQIPVMYPSTHVPAATPEIHPGALGFLP